MRWKCAQRYVATPYGLRGRACRELPLDINKSGGAGPGCRRESGPRSKTSRASEMGLDPKVNNGAQARKKMCKMCEIVSCTGEHRV